MAKLELRDLRKRFGAHEVLHGVDLDVEDGEFVVLVGPSGCGKSTLLRMIAGLEDISGGDLTIAGRPANDVPARRRNVAMVFQSYALFPHMTVRENIAFGPKVRREDVGLSERRVAGAAETLNLTPYLDRYPRELSGGQRQRVAMGRSIVREPDVFLFDEPLSNLDAALRVQMRTEIKALHQQLSATTVYVTHDQIEAMTMADRIVVMRAGRIEQAGPPLDLYDRPANRFVAGFLGSPAMSFVDGRLDSVGDRRRVVTADGIDLPAPAVGAPIGAEVTLGVRPEDLSLAPEGVPFAIDVIEPTGAETLVFGRIGSAPVRCVVRGRTDVRPGTTARLAYDPDRAHLFAPDGGRHPRAGGG